MHGETVKGIDIIKIQTNYVVPSAEV